jgi:hypothetical protein
LPRFFAAASASLVRCENHRRLMLCHGRYDVDRELIGLRKVHRDKLKAGFHQAADKMHIARKSVELRNDQGGAMEAAGGERLCKLRPVSPLAALDLGELGNELPIPAVQIIAYRFLLGIEAKTRPPLAPYVPRLAFLRGGFLRGLGGVFNAALTTASKRRCASSSLY